MLHNNFLGKVQLYWFKWAIISIFVLSGCSSGNITQANEAKNNNWEGTWEITDPKSGEKINLILRADKKVYILAPPTSNEVGQVLEIPLTKISDNTDLPPGAEPISLVDLLQGQAAKARESAAKNQLGAINRAQQAYRLEYPTFASSIEALQIGKVVDLGAYYDFKIISANSQQTYATATAKKPGLRSFSGVVTVDPGQTISTSKLCNTPSPSQTPPPSNCEPSQ